MKWCSHSYCELPLWVIKTNKNTESLMAHRMVRWVRRVNLHHALLCREKVFDRCFSKKISYVFRSSCLVFAAKFPWVSRCC